MEKLVGIDSHIFIWGIREVATSGQEDKIEKARKLIRWLSDKEYRLLLPTPMLAEILSAVPKEDRIKVSSLIDKKFIVAPFDVPAANKCAELLHNSFKNPELIQYKNDHAIPKQKMKYDCMIAAICIVRKVECIYSEDGDLSKFANGELQVKEIPLLSLPGVQTQMSFQ
ncbi:Predicted nucleic acid-binding protein, contains PIN domain [Hydrobacter penzbergensis]|uniref:Predicted nucleic acid-binding protein, contains PIN domain n=1 Tax=Hydrobacter penzbergensis TaxID=1235997 RepID=A0A8X8LCU5_9BACT|nr:PIN domain-containing protein [Hydrobacter penzbergensis]SDW18426.1 Predicted nucleic acid-binding protein, contains PIN domain [Hydrobacter penzbergensis]